VESWLGQSLGSLFVHHYVPLSVKSNVEDIAKEIRHSAAERIGSTEWFSESTHAKAKEKVQNVTLSVAYPSKFHKESYVELSQENLIENIMTLAALDFHNELERVNKHTKLKTWDDTVFAVNAYYYNEGNHLFLPSGILRWPFYHCNASDGWNFGGIGATIGHELCHAFDDDGKEYDQHGVKHSWWSAKNIQAYEERSNALVQLFSKTMYVGKHIDGRHTLSENIADLGGLAIALKALKERLVKRNLNSDMEEYKEQLRDFFHSFAVSWRTKERHQKALQAIFMDVHAPAIARVNNIVSQLDDWYECFQIQESDKLYVKPEDRIRIF
jgi:predicted metalloendopeptidase